MGRVKSTTKSPETLTSSVRHGGRAGVTPQAFQRKTLAKGWFKVLVL